MFGRRGVCTPGVARAAVRLAAVFGLLGLLSGQAVKLLRGPYLQNVQANRASILWTTREAGSGAVVLSDGQNRWTFQASAHRFPADETRPGEVFYQYEADLAGLRAGTSYDYHILFDGGELAPPGGASQGFRFNTPGGGRFAFLVVGDSGSGAPAQWKLASLMNAEPDISMVVHVGDLAYGEGTLAQFESFYFAPYRSLMSRAAFFPTPGNHEYYTEGATAYFGVHSLPSQGVPAQDQGRYYSFDWNGAHFVSLDSNLLGGPVEARMLSWLENDLAHTSKFWKIVFFHHTPYPSGHHLDDPHCALARERLLPAIERHGVQLVLNGHEHSYQRTLQLAQNKPVEAGTGTLYVNTSGGGGELQSIGSLALNAVAQRVYNYVRVDIDGAQLTLRASLIDGSELDRVVLAPKPQLTGISNASNPAAGLARGSLASVSGLNLSPAEGHTVGFARTEHTGLNVSLNGTALPLSSASAHNLELQLPFDAPSSGSLQVQTSNGTASYAVHLAEAAPVILRMFSGQQTLDSDRPAGAGTTIRILATGLGSVKGTLTGGLPAPGAALPVANPVVVSVGGHNLAASSASLLPDKPGLYEVRVTVPAGLSPGTYPVVLIVAGVPSPVAMLRVGARVAAPVRGDEAP